MKHLTFGALLTVLATPLFPQASAVAPAASQPSERAILRIAREVQRGVNRLPEYGLFDDIRFSIKGYEVTVKGKASRPILKSSVENVVRKIEGVENVTNEIEVLPLSRQDDDIRLAAYVAIYGHASLSRYNPNRGSPIFRSRASVVSGITNDPPQGFHPIHIIVKNGNITLEGAVDTMGDRTIAELQANSVPGSFRVTNNLSVPNAEMKQLMK